MPFGKKNAAAEKKEPRWDERKNPPEYVAVDRPPLLEDVAHEGPFRVQVPALKTMSSYVREVVEEDYGWWRYSKLALPLLLFILALLVTVLSLSLWQHNGSLKEFKAGVPRDIYHRENYDDDAEGRNPMVDANGNFVQDQGIGKRHRHLRVSYQVLGFLAIVTVYIAYFLRVKPVIRLATSALAALLLFVAAGCALYTAGATMGKTDNVYETSWDWRYTRQRVTNREDYATVHVIADFIFAFLAVVSILYVLYSSYFGYFKLRARGWRQRNREDTAEFVKPQNRAEQPHGQFDRVSYTYSGITHVFLVALLVVTIISSAFTILNWVTLRAPTRSGYQNGPLELSGWPVMNQRLRIAAAAIGIITVLLNLLPVRSRAVNMIWAFLLSVTCVLLWTSFAADVVTLNDTDGSDDDSDDDFKYVCPQDPSNGLSFVCRKTRFFFTVGFSAFAATVLMFYLAFEVFFRVPSKHSGRGYPIWEAANNAANECSKRPVTCELTGWTGEAGEWYYKRRGQVDPIAAQGPATTQVDVPGGLVVPVGTFYDQVPYDVTVPNAAHMPVPNAATEAEGVRSRVPIPVYRGVSKTQAKKLKKQLAMSTCDGCGLRVQDGELPEHLTHDCPVRSVECHMCGDMVPHQMLEKHQDHQCPNRLLDCAVTGMAVMAKDAARHLASLGKH